MLAPITHSAIAPAKLNLYLHIIGKRDDGYHLLDSLVAFTSFGDHISVAHNDDLVLEVEGDFAAHVGAVDDNLIMRAASLLQAHLQEDTGAIITLNKRIPVGAGLGGGSSDAATVMLLLCKLWGHIVPHKTLCELALPLGADIPACIYGRPAFISGIGEIIEPATDVASLSVLLVNPNAMISTESVYKHYTHENRKNMRPRWHDNNAEHFLASLEPCRNHLQRAAIAVNQKVAEVLIALETQIGKGLVRMSGSGSTCFALYENPLTMYAVADDLRHMYPHWWIMETELRTE